MTNLKELEERIEEFNTLSKDLMRAAAFSERAYSEAVEISIRANARAKGDPYLIALAREAADCAIAAHMASELHRLQLVSFEYHAKLYELKKAARRMADYASDSRHKNSKLRSRIDELANLADHAVDSFTQ